jgi:mRNA interferase RelE/StbE
MVYDLLYTDSSLKDLDRLEKRDRDDILKKLDFYIKLPDPFTKAKKLKNFSIDTYRFRVGDYRIIFRKDPKTSVLVVLIILKIAHRKEVYK